ncbi:potassium channel regulator activity protein [Homalodisca vitripennis]|nr:potassium channel regulator activity protein [Homalodisca vitripennis]
MKVNALSSLLKAFRAVHNNALLSIGGEVSLCGKAVANDRQIGNLLAVRQDVRSTYSGIQAAPHKTLPTQPNVAVCWDRYGEKQRRADSQELSGIQLLSATAYQLKKPYQQLLIPITIWIGMEQAFIGADFTQSCDWDSMFLPLGL